MKKFKVTTHTIYEEVWEVEHDGEADDFFDSADYGEKWTRLSSTDVTKLVETGVNVEDVEELD
jgi:hypothetical protein